MTRRHGLRIAAALAVLACVVPGRAGAQDPEPTDPAGAGQSDTSGLLPLAACIQAERHLVVTFVIDESGSLTETDPDARRVDAAVNALDRLSELAADDDQATTIDIEVAAFSDRYRVARTWTELDDSTAPVVRRALTSFRTRVDGIETDIVNAVDGAQRAIGQRVAEVGTETGRTPCKAVVLFTDGGYVVNQRTPDQFERYGTSKSYAPGADLRTVPGKQEAMRAGKAAMCDPGGLADRVRGDDIVVLGVLLHPEPDTRIGDFLSGISTGVYGDVACGRMQTDGSGVYLQAANADALIAGFDEITARVGGGTPVPTERDLTVCGDEGCADGRQQVEVDALTRRIRVLALAPNAGARLRITGPDGSTVIEEPGAFEIDGVSGVASDVAGRGLSVTIDRPDDDAGWAGTWSFTVEGDGELAGEAATVQAYVFSDVAAQFEVGEFRRGEPADLRATLVLPDGAVAGDLVRSVTARALIEDPVSGRQHVVDLDGPVDGPFVGSFTAPDDLTANAVHVAAELTVENANGTRVVTRSPRDTVLVRRPEGSVQFEPAQLSMPPIEGEGSTEADLTVIGGSGEGCVWLESSSFGGASGLTVLIDGAARTDQASCLRVAAGETVVVPIELRSTEGVDASVAGVLRLREETAGGTGTVTDLEVSTSLVRVVDQARRVVLAGLLLVGGLLLPLGLLLVINAVTARFQDLDAVRGSAIRIRVVGGVAQRLDESNRRVRLTSDDFESLAGTGNVRRFTFGGVQFRAGASRNPFGATWAQATPEGGAEKLRGGVGRRIELDPALAGSWVFLLDPDATRANPVGTAEGTLLAFVAEGATGDQYRRLHDDLDARLSSVAADLESAVRSGATATPSGRRKRDRADASAR